MALLGTVALLACGDGSKLRGLAEASPPSQADAPSAAPLSPIAVPKKGPPYPIVLAHGFFGTDSFAGQGFLTYFYEVKDALEQAGETQVFTPAVDPFNDSDTRGAELLRQIEELLEQTGHAKVNVIAHSQAGIDARVVASARPDLIASISTVSTPHRGTPLADPRLLETASPLTERVLDTLVRLVGARIWNGATPKSSLQRAFVQLSEPAMAEFNERHPLPDRLPFFSMAGRSGLRKNSDECRVPDGPEFLSRWDDEVDPVNVLLAPTETLLSPNELFPVGNDGLVPVASAKLGTFLGCFPADHLDEIGHIAGASPGLGNAWRHKPFYVALVAFLREQGL